MSPIDQHNGLQSNSPLNANLTLISKRWPQLMPLLQQTQPLGECRLSNTPEPTLCIDGIHLSSGYDRSGEAMLQASLVPQNAATAWVYGFGSGDLIQALLQRKHLKTLHVVILNPAVASASCTWLDHRAWLADPRVNILTASQIEGLQRPFAAVPACLKLADDASARLRDLVFLELATPYIRQKHGAGNVRLMARLKENRDHCQKDGDVGSLFDCHCDKTVLVAGAGPTLPESFEWIKSRQQAGLPLLAVGSALKPLVDAAIIPDVVLLIDPEREDVLKLLDGFDLSPLSSTPLVYFPSLHREVLRLWPGPLLTAYPEHPLYKELFKDFPKEKLFSSGSVLHPTVDLAVRMGAAKIILLGADFAYPYDQTHAFGAAHTQKTATTVDGHWVHDGYGNRIATSPNLRGFLRDLEDYIAEHPMVRFVNASRKGALIKGTSFLEGAS